MSAFNLIRQLTDRILFISCLGLLILAITISLPRANALEQTNELNSSQRILWLSHYQDSQSDLELKGFNHRTKNQFIIDYLNVKQANKVDSHLTQTHYDYFIAVGDQAWQIINSLEHPKTNNSKTKLIGIGVSRALFNQVKLNSNGRQYLISRGQPTSRIFAMLKSMDLSLTQSAALFYKNQQSQKKDFIVRAKEFDIPFKTITIQPKSNTLEIINTVFSCCRVLYLKQTDFESSRIKHKSILFESYRRKIITITDNPELLKHGAMFAIYSQPHQLGQQTAEMINNLTANVKVEPFQEPANFVIDSNHKIKNIIGGSLANLSNGALIEATKFSELTNTGNAI